MKYLFLLKTGCLFLCLHRDSLSQRYIPIASACCNYTLNLLQVILYEELYQFTTDNEHEIAAVRREHIEPIGDASTIPLFFGSIIYAFEGIGVVSTAHKPHCNM